MFGFLAKNKSDDLYSPVNGKSIPIEQVPDKLFANKLLGDGVAFVFEGDTIYAPCDGEIIMVASTRHAFGMKTKNGTEILVHVGVETVNLNGEGFNTLVKPGAKVKAHQPIMRIDRPFMQKMKMDLTTPMIITNLVEAEADIKPCREVDPETIVIQIKKQ